MQAAIAKDRPTRHTTRPITGSAFLTGKIVIVTTPSLTTSDNLLAIGDQWTDVRIPTGVEHREAMRNA